MPSCLLSARLPRVPRALRGAAVAATLALGALASGPAHASPANDLPLIWGDLQAVAVITERPAASAATVDGEGETTMAMARLAGLEAAAEAPASEPQAAPVAEAEAEVEAAPEPEPAEVLYEVGIASTYGTGDGFQGRRTACGQIFDTWVPQVAHKTLPCGTVVRVEDVATGRSVVVRVTDRGPYIRGRVVDLSYSAYRQLDASGPGLRDVRVYLLP